MGEKDILSALFDEQDAKRSKGVIDSSDDINKDAAPAPDSQSDSDNNQEEIESRTEEQMGESEDEETVTDAKVEEDKTYWSKRCKRRFYDRRRTIIKTRIWPVLSY